MGFMRRRVGGGNFEYSFGCVELEMAEGLLAGDDLCAGKCTTES